MSKYTWNLFISLHNNYDNCTTLLHKFSLFNIQSQFKELFKFNSDLYKYISNDCIL